MSEAVTDAERDLAQMGPGGFCESCGHFAERHWTDKCHFPYEDRDCDCSGMVWRGERVSMQRVIDEATR